jgi:hypothetical protein
MPFWNPNLINLRHYEMAPLLQLIGGRNAAEGAPPLVSKEWAWRLPARLLLFTWEPSVLPAATARWDCLRGRAAARSAR